MYQATTTIGCTTGYTLSGTADITCQADGTWTATPTCDPADCGTVTIANGVATAVGGTTLTNTVTIACNSGYTLSGAQSLICTATGYDNALPTCDIQDCGSPVTKDGSADTPKGTTYGELAIISCNTGYSLVGNDLITCEAGSTWSESPTCTIKDCGDPTPTFGTSSDTTNMYQATTTIGCTTGYTLSGTADITCQADGTWTATPTCDPADCGTVTIANGVATAVGGTTLTNTVTIACNSGYTLSGAQSLICTATGYDNALPTCDIQDCGSPVPTDGSADTLKGTTYGEVAIISCNTGYSLFVNDLITCEAGSTWSESPTCTIKDCAEPPDVDNSNINTGDTIYGSVRTYTCKEGYSTGNDEVSMETTCASDSTWTDPDFTCYKDCGEPPNKIGATIDPGLTEKGTKRAYVCDYGYTTTSKISDRTITCLDTGSWTLSDFTCERLTTIGDECEEDSDCTITSGKCVENKCFCDTFYRFNDTDADCVQVCTTSTDFFNSYSGENIRGYNDIENQGEVVESAECESLCRDDPECMMFEVRYKGDGTYACNRGTVSLEQVMDADPSKWRTSQSWTLFSRICI